MAMSLGKRRTDGYFPSIRECPTHGNRTAVYRKRVSSHKGITVVMREIFDILMQKRNSTIETSSVSIVILKCIEFFQ
ncbi:hypothetical protein KIN20_034471 [Parelaphostrongylus tenuis]|uniref:Uncharacterized protein n=1 Tax=Parelaphostrongylus tenuis TaxID=148309 RepID=A0AAD5WK26_PARTN|nr:hypothetical protein KIN20_034471 [Parelaphostrongylus tenuis]